MTGSVLYRPDEHEPLVERPWDEAEARAAIARVVEAAERGLPENGLWPAHPEDLDAGEEGPFTIVYLGAAGVAWALGQLGSSLDARVIVEQASKRYLERPDLGEAEPSGIVGEAGFARILGDDARLERC